MPLDYSKWDNLEISDDSDIEVHPNVDKRSMIKWKQEAIHQKRAERKEKMDYIKKFVPQQERVLEKIRQLSDTLRHDDARVGIEDVLKILKQQQVDADPNMKVPAPSTQSKEMNVKEVFEAMQKQIEVGLNSVSPEEMKKSLLERFDQVEKTVQKTVEGATQELAKLEAEANKKLTSENMFKETANKTILNKPKPLPLKKTEKVIETLNPSASLKALSIQDSGEDADVEDEEEEDIEMSPLQTKFSKIKGFEDSYKFLKTNPDIINEKSSDAILGNAFTSQLKGNDKDAINCVTQSLTLQYCGQLGRDGIDTFFKKMSLPNSPGQKLFFDDVKKTYDRIKSRCAEIVSEQDEVETIQLQSMGDGSQLTIRVPTADDAEAYAIYEKMPVKFKEALNTGKLEEINKVLEVLPVPIAENLVGLCSEFGFLDVESEVIDETQRE